MKIKFLLTVSFLFSFFSFTYAQDDIQIGSPPGSTRNTAGAWYDYSDPNGVNIKVQLWGYVGNPGYYIVPAGLSIHELISYAGGPGDDALLDKIRVVKIKEGSQTVMNIYNYNDLMWKNEIKTQIQYVKLEAGDIIVVPGEPRFFLREDISFYLSIITALASLWALIFTITNN